MSTQPGSALRGRRGRDSTGVLRRTWHVGRAEPDTRPDVRSDTTAGVPTDPTGRAAPPGRGRRALTPAAKDGRWSRSRATSTSSTTSRTDPHGERAGSGG